jgi:hypothetical protein
VSQISEHISSIRAFVPAEFQRKLRPLNELEHYKATEFRFILLYIGPFILKPFLPLSYLKHFALLHFSCYVFASERFYHLHGHATRCIEIFVKQMSQLFGQQSLIYNVHVLLHLPHFVSIYGKLDNFSAFPFENFLSLLKKRIKATNAMDKHALNQLLTVRSIFTGTTCNDTPDSDLYSNKCPNNCALLTNGKVIYITHVHSPSLVSGYRLIFSKNLYDYPYASSALGIGYYRMSDIYEVECCPVVKCICIPVQNEYVVLPYA